MSKQLVKEKMRGKAIAVVRNEDYQTAYEVCKTLILSGVSSIEVTFSVKEAARLIQALRQEFPQATVGAGTVINLSQAQVALDSGAQFLVSPMLLENLGDFCREKKVFCSLGASTVTECWQAHNQGADVVKIFPGDIVGPGFIKAVKAPLPFLDLMPTGGVDSSNIAQWFKAGAFAVGLGGSLTGGIGLDNLDILKVRCKELLEAIER